jgi:RNase P/RNase MRP subunit POP5
MIREKHRYILVECGASIDKIDASAFSDALYKELLDCIGSLSYHRVRPRVVKVLNANTFVLRTSLYGCGNVVAALALIKRIGGMDSYFYTLKTSGTIKALLK